MLWSSVGSTCSSQCCFALKSALVFPRQGRRHNVPQSHGTSVPTAPILLRAQRWPHCSEQKAPVYVWCWIRTVSVLGQISPHLRLLASVVVDVLGWSHPSWGVSVFLNSRAFSHRLLEMNAQREGCWNGLLRPRPLAVACVTTRCTPVRGNRQGNPDSCLEADALSPVYWNTRHSGRLKAQYVFPIFGLRLEKKQNAAVGLWLSWQSRGLPSPLRRQPAPCQRLGGSPEVRTALVGVRVLACNAACRGCWARCCCPRGLGRSEVMDPSLRTMRVRDDPSQSICVLVRGFLRVPHYFCTISKHDG